MSAEAAAVARRAAEIHQERGHCKGEMSTEDGSTCLHGAVLEAAQELTGAGHSEWERRTRIITEINEAIKAIVPFDYTAYSHLVSEEVGLNEEAQEWTEADALDYYKSFPAAAEVNDQPDTDEADVAKVLLQVADRLEIES